MMNNWALVVALVSVLCLLWCAVLGSAAAESPLWPSLYGSASHTGYSPQSIPVTNPWTVQWKQRLISQWGGIALGEGVLIVWANTFSAVTYSNGTVTCFDINPDGATFRWAANISTYLGNPIQGAIIGGDGVVYITQLNEGMTALDIHTGDQVYYWTPPSLEAVDVPSIDSNGILYLNAMTFYALDVSARPMAKVLWKTTEANCYPYGGLPTALSSDGTIVWTICEYQVVAYSIPQQRRLCTLPTPQGGGVGVVVNKNGNKNSENIAFFAVSTVGSDGTYIVAVKGDDKCSVVWKVSLGNIPSGSIGIAIGPSSSSSSSSSSTSSSFSSNVEREEVLYVAVSSTNQLFAFYPSDGKILWKYALPSHLYIDNTPTIDKEGYVYVAGSDGWYVLDSMGNLKMKNSSLIPQGPTLHSASGSVFVPTGVVNFVAMPSPVRKK